MSGDRIQLDPKAVKKMKKMFRRLEEGDALRPAMNEAVQHIHGKLAKPPAKRPGAFSAMATPRQKRAYWARVSSGDITHIDGMGYRRSNVLMRRWNTSVSADGREGKIANNAPYADYVQGPRQQPFHDASKWPTVDEVAEKESDTVLSFFVRALDRLIGGEHF